MRLLSLPRIDPLFFFCKGFTKGLGRVLCSRDPSAFLKSFLPAFTSRLVIFLLVFKCLEQFCSSIGTRTMLTSRPTRFPVF